MRAEDHDFVAVGADVDVHALMGEIRAEVERKRRAGLYPPEVMAELDLARPQEDADDQLANALLGLHHAASFTPEVTTASRKGGGLAPAASAFKRVVRGSVQWYIVGILQQIQLFAVHTIRTVTLLADRLWALERAGAETALDELRAELDRLLDELRARSHDAAGTREEIFRRLEALEETVQEAVRNRLPHLERQLRGMRTRLERSPAERELREGGAERSYAADRSIDYFSFESHFRGSEEEIREKQRSYVEIFRGGPEPVIDLGCGRGEFLELLREGGVEAYGVDRHPDMVDRCREKGLRAVEGDALEHLRGLEPKSLGGIFSAQMIEHLEIPDVPRLFELAADVLKPGGYFVVETINPESLFVFAGAFYVDLGHLRPLHPLTLRFLAEQAGFGEVRIEYSSLPPAELRPLPLEGPQSLGGVIDTLNENFRRLDRILFGPQDYALIARR